MLIDELRDEHGTILRDELGIGPISAAALLCEVGDPHRFDRESKFARWSGAVALSSREGSANPVKHRLDLRGNRRINSVLCFASVTQQRSQPGAVACLPRKATEGKTRRGARRALNRHLADRIIRYQRHEVSSVSVRGAVLIVGVVWVCGARCPIGLCRVLFRVGR